MPLSKDLREFLELLNSDGVDYLIVGAFAVAYYGHPRYTGDLDILVRPGVDNAERVLRTLDAFGFGGLGIEGKDLESAGTVIQLGIAPNRIDLLTAISGIDFAEAWKTRELSEMDGVPVPFIGLDALIRNKEAAGRAKDRGDAEELRRIAAAKDGTND